MKLKTSLALLLAFSSTAFAASTDCPKHYVDGVAPDITLAAASKDTQELCYTAFGTMHSGLSLTPLWSAEFLTADRITAAAKLTRRGEFHAETRLPLGERAELEDYKGSGYDRGHMSPNGDMPDRVAQQESFSLANMVPQAPKINQGIWAAIENGVRTAVLGGRSFYVITGPIFDAETLDRINDRVLVPNAVFKAIYDPQTKQAGAYVATNEKTSTTRAYDTLSIAELEQRLNLSLFPQLPLRVKQTKMDLPPPKAH